MDVWENTTGSDGNTTHKFVQFLVVADGQLDVAWHNAGFLVVTCGVTGKFQDFGAQVFKDSGAVTEELPPARPAIFERACARPSRRG